MKTLDLSLSLGRTPPLDLSSPSLSTENSRSILSVARSTPPTKDLMKIEHWESLTAADFFHNDKKFCPNLVNNGWIKVNKPSPRGLNDGRAVKWSERREVAMMKAAKRVVDFEPEAVKSRADTTEIHSFLTKRRRLTNFPVADSEEGHFGPASVVGVSIVIPAPLLMSPMMIEWSGGYECPI